MPAEGIEPGPRECHDAREGKLRVDFVYPEASPQPIALEITGIWDGKHRGGVRRADRATVNLSEIAEREQLGAWLAAVRTDENLRDLQPEILNVIRTARPNRERMLRNDEQIRPGQYTANDLARLPSRKAERRFMEAHDRLKQMGLVEVKPIHGRREHVIAILPMTSVRDVVGFGDDLENAIEDNARKLGEADRYEHHLAVYVERFNASRSSDLTPPPHLPDEIDVLWVVHQWRDHDERYPTWVVSRGDTEWRVDATPGGP